MLCAYTYLPSKSNDASLLRGDPSIGVFPKFFSSHSHVNMDMSQPGTGCVGEGGCGGVAWFVDVSICERSVYVCVCENGMHECEE